MRIGPKFELLLVACCCCCCCTTVDCGRWPTVTIVLPICLICAPPRNVVGMIFVCNGLMLLAGMVSIIGRPANWPVVVFVMVVLVLGSIIVVVVVLLVLWAVEAEAEAATTRVIPTGTGRSVDRAEYGQ